MIMLTRSERLALLLTLLGEEARAIARETLNGQPLSELEESLDDFEKHPATNEEIDLVLEDFKSYFRLAAQNAADAPDQRSESSTGANGGSLKGEGNTRGSGPIDGPRILQIAEEQFEVELEPKKRFESMAPTGNIRHDLNRLHPYQVATALKEESAAIASIVISHLATEHAAKTLEFLPSSLRKQTIMTMANPSQTRPLVVQRILDTTLQQALKVEERTTDEESSAKLADLMRSLPPALRAPIMEDLMSKDEALAEAVKTQLYRFEDIERLSDRDMQKFLGKCNTDVLVIALQQADADLLQRILGNMSKRAKETLQEEMEYSANAKQDEIESQRQVLAGIIAELSESGEVELT